ncbi:hypothetical protein [Mycobacterium sp.]|nr:hypothetical protein [Mycobacterium sp.]
MIAVACYVLIGLAWLVDVWSWTEDWRERRAMRRSGDGRPR